MCEKRQSTARSSSKFVREERKVIVIVICTLRDQHRNVKKNRNIYVDCRENKAVNFECRSNSVMCAINCVCLCVLEAHTVCHTYIYGPRIIRAYASSVLRSECVSKIQFASVILSSFFFAAVLSLAVAPPALAHVPFNACTRNICALFLFIAGLVVWHLSNLHDMAFVRFCSFPFSLLICNEFHAFPHTLDIFVVLFSTSIFVQD